MRGRPAKLPEITAQGVAVKVNLAFKDAGFKAGPSDLGRARYAFGERITGRSFILSFRQLSAPELLTVHNAADNQDTVKVFLKDFELERYRQHAKRIMHGFSVSTPAPLENPRTVLETRIAEALKEAAYHAHRA